MTRYFEYNIRVFPTQSIQQSFELQTSAYAYQSILHLNMISIQAYRCFLILVDQQYYMEGSLQKIKQHGIRIMKNISSLPRKDYNILNVYSLVSTSATLARSLRDVWRIKHPPRDCFMLILGTSCLAGRIFNFIVEIGLKGNLTMLLDE